MKKPTQNWIGACLAIVLISAGVRFIYFWNDPIRVEIRKNEAVASNEKKVVLDKAFEMLCTAESGTIFKAGDHLWIKEGNEYTFFLLRPGAKCEYALKVFAGAIQEVYHPDDSTYQEISIQFSQQKLYPH